MRDMDRQNKDRELGVGRQGRKVLARAGSYPEKDMLGHSLLWWGFLCLLTEWIRGFHDQLNSSYPLCSCC